MPVLLHRNGLTVQVPRRQVIEGDKNAVAMWAKQVRPQAQIAAATRHAYQRSLSGPKTLHGPGAGAHHWTGATWTSRTAAEVVRKCASVTADSCW